MKFSSRHWTNSPFHMQLYIRKLNLCTYINSTLCNSVCLYKCNHNHRTSMRVIRTGVILTCRSPSLPAVASLSHGPRDCPASLSNLVNDRPMHYWFFTFRPGGLTLGHSSPKWEKGEMTWWTPRSTILHNFIALRPPTPEISVTKILQTDKNKQVCQLSGLA